MFGCDDGTLHSVNASDGAPLWSFGAEGPIRSSPAVNVNGSTIYVVTQRLIDIVILYTPKR